MENKTLSAFEKINLIRGFNDEKMSFAEKSLLLIISTHLGDNDFAWLSLTTLSHESCLTRANVNINIKKLIDRGYLQKLSPSDGYKSCRFVINFENIDTSIAAILVSERYQTSIAAIPPQYRSDTSLVSQRYPNRKIIENEKKDKRKRVPRTFSFSSNQKQNHKQEQELLPIIPRDVPTGHFIDGLGKIQKISKPPAELKNVLRTLSGKTLINKRE